MIKMGKGDFDQGLQRRRAKMLGKTWNDEPVDCIVDVGCGNGMFLYGLKNYAYLPPLVLLFW